MSALDKSPFPLTADVFYGQPLTTVDQCSKCQLSLVLPSSRLQSITVQIPNLHSGLVVGVFACEAGKMGLILRKLKKLFLLLNAQH